MRNIALLIFPLSMFTLAHAQPLPRMGEGLFSHLLFPVESLKERAIQHVRVIRTVENRLDRNRMTDTCYTADFDSQFRLTQESNFETYPFEFRQIKYRDDSTIRVMEQIRMRYKAQSPPAERLFRYYNSSGQLERMVEDCELNGARLITETRLTFDSLGRKQYVFSGQDRLSKAFEYLPSGDVKRQTEYFYENIKGEPALDSIVTFYKYDDRHRLQSETRQPSPTFGKNIGIICGRDINNRVRYSEYDSLGRITRKCGWSLQNEPGPAPYDCDTITYRLDSLDELLVLSRQQQDSRYFNSVMQREIEVRYAPEAEIDESDVLHSDGQHIYFLQTLYIKETKLPFWITLISGAEIKTFEFLYAP